MFKKMLICALICSNILAMEEEKSVKKTTSQETTFNALVAANLNKFPEDKQKEIRKYLSLGEMPTEIKEMIARNLVDGLYIRTTEMAIDDLNDDLNNLAMVNKQFHDIINSDSFIKYMVTTLQNKLGLNNVTTASFFPTPRVANWLKKQKVDPRNIMIEMHSAASQGDLDKLKFLFAIGGNIEDSFALTMASQYGWFLVVEFLLTKNPSQEQKDKALIEAIKTGTEDVSQYGAGTAGYDPDDALENVVKLLIEAGADVNAHDWEQKSALTLAKEKNLDSIVKILEQAGAR